MSPTNFNCGKRMRISSSHSKRSNMSSTRNSEQYLERFPRAKLSDTPSRSLAAISPPSPFLPDQKKNRNSDHQSQNRMQTKGKFEIFNDNKGISRNLARDNLPSSPPPMPRHLRESSRLSLRPKSQLGNLRVGKNSNLSPFSPVRSPPSNIRINDTSAASPAVMKKENNINDANIQDSTKKSDHGLDELLLAVPSSTPSVAAMPTTMKSDLLSRKSETHLDLLSHAPQDRIQIQNNGLLIHSPPKKPLKARNVPGTCHRRKKPSGYQQAGRDDAEEGEDSSEDWDNRCYNHYNNHFSSNRNGSHALFNNRDSSNLSNELEPKTPSLNSNHDYDRENAVEVSSPGGNESSDFIHCNHPLSSSYMATPKKGLGYNRVSLPQNRYPFSPNPFSPHYSPIPPPQQSVTENSSFSPNMKKNKIHLDIPAMVPTPRKHHTALPKTPRGFLGRRSSNFDPSRSVDSHNSSFEVNSVKSMNCNMSTTTHVPNDHASDLNGDYPQCSFNKGRSNTSEYGCESRNQTPSRINNCKLDKSFDSTLTPSSPSVDSIMSIDITNMRPPQNGSSHSNLRIECQQLNDCSKSSNQNKGISPTEVVNFPMPQTPHKQGFQSIQTPSEKSIDGTKDANFDKSHVLPLTPTKQQFTSLSEKDDQYNFLHTNMQIDKSFGNATSSVNNSHVGSPSSPCTPNPGYQQHFPVSRFATDFEEVGQVGTGSFGTVYKCMSRLDGCMYAIKTAKRKAKGNADRDRMMKEVYALAALSDQPDTGTFHIVRYHQAWMEEERLFIQTELCTSTLEEELKDRVLLRCVPRRYKLLREILLALELIHRNNMVHLDIKPENIFIKGDQYKLGDFGLVTKATTEDDVEEGDSRYMSLELLSGDNKDLTKSDIFSLGASLYEVCIGRPLPANGNEWHKIRNNDLDFVSTKPMSSKPATETLEMISTPHELQEIIRKMMCREPSKRPSAIELLKLGPLLSEEQKKLKIEQNKVKQAYQSLEEQKRMLSKFTPKRKKLVRASTWDYGSMNGKR